VANLPGLSCAQSCISECVIISPFISTAIIEKKLTRIEQKFNGIFFLKGLTGDFGASRLTFISTTPSGSLPADTVFFLKDSPAQRFIFAGSFGALFPTAQGSIYYVQHSYSSSSFTDFWQHPELRLNHQENSLPAQIPGITRNLTGISVLTVSSLSAEADKSWLKELKNSGIEGLDLEAGSFLAAAAHVNKLASAVLFAADFPLSNHNILENPAVSRSGKKLVNNYVDRVLELACISP